MASGEVRAGFPAVSGLVPSRNAVPSSGKLVFSLVFLDMGVRQERRLSRAGIRGLIFFMLVTSAAIVLKRSEIRAQWWAWRLGNAQNSNEISYFSACLAGVGAKGVFAVIPLLNSDRTDIRISAAWILGQAHDPSANEALTRSLQDRDEDVRALAATQLGIASDTAVVARLSRIASEEPVQSAVAATLALEKSQAPEADQALQHLAIQGRFPELRAQAVESLGRRRSPDAKSTLLACLSDSAVVEGILLGERRDQRVLAAVIQRVPGIPSADTLPAAGRTIADIAGRALTRLTGENCGYRTPIQSADIDRLRQCWSNATISTTTLPAVLP